MGIHPERCVSRKNPPSGCGIAPRSWMISDVLIGRSGFMIIYSSVMVVGKVRL
jgi:hypothetical protein